MIFFIKNIALRCLWRLLLCIGLPAVILLFVNKMSVVLQFCLHNVKRCYLSVFLIYDACF